MVHGDIRHLEKEQNAPDDQITVHGDIRHLEIRYERTRYPN